jgi:hypothetical protein
VLVRVHAPAIETNGYLGCRFPAQTKWPPIGATDAPPLKPGRWQAASPAELWREFTRSRVGAALQPNVQLCVIRKRRVSVAPER